MTLTTNCDIVKVFDFNNLSIEKILEIRKLYEDCKIPVIDNFVSDETINFIKENVNIDTEPIQCQEEGYKEWKDKYKKINKLESFFQILKRKSEDTERSSYLLFHDLENKINNFIYKTLGYKIITVSRTYRFTRTEKENLHFDNFEPVPKGYGFLRVFINLDDEDRIWNNSINLYDYINLKKNEIKRFIYENNTKIEYSGQNRINDFVMKHFMDSGFGDQMDNLFSNSIPKIQTKFSPGSIWICDSIKNSHQIVYGKKCISFNYVIDGSSYSNKDNLYCNKISEIINELN
tara:strand:+ start:859 stop:1728 length:870 start_codon:yes stop_codon:yes gene_type:complete